MQRDSSKPVAKKTRIRIPGPTCSECRRRHQKCVSRGEGPCLNCLRRYPPVVCASLGQTTADSQPRGIKRKFPSRARKDAISEDDPPPREFDAMVVVKSESPKAFGGLLSAVNACNSIPVHQTSRNTELFQLFLDRVIPKLSSIDGIAAPSIYSQTRIPWMIQSPLMPNIVILLASFAQGMERGEDVNRRQETLALKVKALALTNEFLAEDFSLVGNDAMLATIHLASLEYIWGHEQSLISHLQGLKEMVRLKGGFGGLTDRITAWVIIMLDFEVAIRYERELFVLPPDLMALMSRASAAIAPAPPFLSPLQSHPSDFAQRQDIMSHSISTSAAEILDDISFLVSAISSSPPSPTSKIRGTATWLHSRLLNLDVKPTTSTTDSADADTNTILCVIRLSAMVYSRSISTLTPLSSSFTPDLLTELYALLGSFTAASLRRWNAIPAIFFWVLLVACPAAGDDHMGRYLRSKMAATRIVLGLENYNLSFAYLRSFWTVQRWIERESGVEQREREVGEFESEVGGSERDGSFPRDDLVDVH